MPMTVWEEHEHQVEHTNNKEDEFEYYLKKQT